MRTYSDFADNETILSLLNGLVAQSTPLETYQKIMTELGKELGAKLKETLSSTDHILVICTNEDADFLARGVVEHLESLGSSHVSVACFWNLRKTVHNVEVAPIVRQYIEPVDRVDVFIVVKSIISSGCVVRTNIAELVHQYTPRKIFVAAPVILEGSTDDIKAEFPESISSQFEFVWFAQDDEKKESGEVVPGIGGSVYERLGIGTSSTKNSYQPTWIASRREALLAANS